MSRLPYTLTEDIVTVFCNGTLVTVRKDDMRFNELREHLRGADHNPQLIMDIGNKAGYISRLTSGKVTVVGSTVYYDGNPVHNTLANKLVDMLDIEHDATPWARFMERLMENPSENSRKQLFDFLERFNTPFTDDGCFIVFKRVTADFKDIRTNTFDNSPGTEVVMPREEVADDPHHACGSGLHVCSIGYLDNAYVNSSQYKTIACKVDPFDVVSVPHDYKYSKIRCCRYVVLGEVDEEGSRYTTEALTNNLTMRDEPINNAANPWTETDEDGLGADSGWNVDDSALPGVGDWCHDLDTDRYGKVIDIFTVTYRDADHPEHADWQNGDIAGCDTDDCEIFVVEYDDGTEDIAIYEGDDRLALAYKIESEQEERDAPPEQSTVSMSTRSGRTLCVGKQEFRREVERLGQRGFDRTYDVPRTTVQEILNRLR